MGPTVWELTVAQLPMSAFEPRMPGGSLQCWDIWQGRKQWCSYLFWIWHPRCKVEPYSVGAYSVAAYSSLPSDFRIGTQDPGWGATA